MLLNVLNQVKYTLCADNAHLSVRPYAVCVLALESKTFSAFLRVINEFLPCFPHLQSDLDEIKYKIHEIKYKIHEIKYKIHGNNYVP
jgi:hypothetical protein